MEDDLKIGSKPQSFEEIISEQDALSEETIVAKEVRSQDDSNLFIFPLLLITVVLTLVLAYTVGAAWDKWTVISANQVAESDFLKLKPKVFEAIRDRYEENRFLFLNQVGPVSYQGPLFGMNLSDQVSATVFHHTFRLRHRSPITVTKIEVFHKLGDRAFRYTEVNGIDLLQTVSRMRSDSANPLRIF